ncbi:hypothetical protein QTP88_009599 [Uroleucon formosanum]
MDTIILATTVLHNFLRNDTCYWQPGELEDTNTPKGLNNLRRVGGNNPREAFIVRENFKQFFVSNGSVPWQWEKAFTARNKCQITMGRPPVVFLPFLTLMYIKNRLRSKLSESKLESKLENSDK